MNIISESSEQLQRIKNKEDLIPLVVDKIFSICKNDPSLSVKTELTDIDSKLTSVKEKLEKQNGLLKKATDMEKQLQMKIKLLEDDSYAIKVRVLENLGSEL